MTDAERIKELEVAGSVSHPECDISEEGEASEVGAEKQQA